MKCHPPPFPYWCLLPNAISFICILTLDLYSTIVLNSHTATAVKWNFLPVNYQHVTICAFLQPPFYLLVWEKENLHKHHKMLRGGDYISFTLQPEEEEVLALLSLALCSYTVPLHYCDWGEGGSCANDKPRKRPRPSSTWPARKLGCKKANPAQGRWEWVDTSEENSFQPPQKGQSSLKAFTWDFYCYTS